MAYASSYALHIPPWWGPELTSAPLADKYTLHQYGIFPTERALLHNRIENRQHALIADGLLEEVKELTKK